MLLNKYASFPNSGNIYQSALAVKECFLSNRCNFCKNIQYIQAVTTYLSQIQVFRRLPFLFSSTACVQLTLKCECLLSISIR